jgi:hypothetical protein
MQMCMSFCGATREAAGQRGVRTLRGLEEDVGGNFDVGLAPDAQEEGPPPLGLTPGSARAPSEPRLGWWVFLTPFIEV